MVNVAAEWTLLATTFNLRTLWRVLDPWLEASPGLLTATRGNYFTSPPSPLTP